MTKDEVARELPRLILGALKHIAPEVPKGKLTKLCKSIDRVVLDLGGDAKDKNRVSEDLYCITLNAVELARLANCVVRDDLKHLMRALGLLSFLL